MNYWTEMSIEYANQRNYLDELFKVYPCVPENIRDMEQHKWDNVEKAFKNNDKVELVKSLLRMKLFPIKDSYVAYLRRDSSAILRNPATIDRLCGRLYELGLDAIYAKCSEPKETNRQIGPLFRRWLEKKHLGVDVLEEEAFLSNEENAILAGTDIQLSNFARKHLDYTGTKGLGFYRLV